MGRLGQLRAAFVQVFAARSYATLAGALAVLVFVVSVWLPNAGLIAQVYSASDAPLAAASAIALKLLGGIWTNFSLLSAASTIADAVLLGVVTAMIAYVVRHRRKAAAAPTIAVGSGAATTGVLGLGCAACGSVILSVVAPALGASGALAALPLEGQEFGLASVALLLASLLLVSKAIADPAACSVDRRDGRGRAIRRTSPGAAHVSPQTHKESNQNATEA